jgi:hypothetical protein
MLRRMFEPKRNEERGECKRLHNEELNALYFSPNRIRVIISRRNIWAKHVARMGERRGAYRVLLGKPKEMRPLGRPRCRMGNNIKMVLTGMEWGAWTGLIWLKIGTGGSFNKMRGISRLAEDLLASQGGLCSMEF